MCGIAGTVTFDGSRVSDRFTETACEVMKHRGPDEVGYFNAPDAALGMCRLSIIGLHGGSQPLFSRDRSVVCVVNGEIYNHMQLRAELERSGYDVDGTSDVAVIPALYQRYGDSFVTHLHGMFAIALLDINLQRVILATDRTGKKPLLHATSASGQLVFASEMQALLTHPGIGRSTCPTAIDAYLSYRVVPAPATIYQDVKKVPPATLISLESSGTRTWQYWDFPFTAELQDEPEEELVATIDALLHQAVQDRLESEVPLGAMLSGGLDSSLVVALAAKKSSEPLHTFSVGFDHPDFDESVFAKEVSDYCSTIHHNVQLNASHAAASIDRILRHMGEPYAFPSAIASDAMYALARKTVEVVLTGDGSDEVFCGYRRYKSLLSLPHGNLADDYEGILVDGLSQANKALLYSDSIKNALGNFPENHLSHRFELTDRKSPRLDRAMHVDARFWLPDAQLVKIDRMSMANSIEPRSPFLDHRLIDYVARIPAARKMVDLNEKALLKSMAVNYLPSSIVNRRKQELAVPLEGWLTTSLRPAIQSTLLSEESLSRDYFDADALRIFVTDFRPENAYALWTLFMLERWHLLQTGTPDPISV
ncbi:asparagine synthase (glutamine-hydrolyzing) [Arthrobacter sp. AK01]|uniref:asparagine synthase (glutamine-hydrolyzing) n=1 Tax=Micrococcaceae TaxID=1268 RepID=UPI001E28F0D1|nr:MULTISPECIES: asparagine synthase (glutamine-hydrolyzing) [Micrococcaceae]MCD4850882.1 asparagine synthase (glutamine-hydrolyzing) [Arthrobacter sp. AK01]MCP1414210.1 asparagine synthase (glutamine-hydrolyzing) [Paenarthrobacter sp. A20]